MRPDPEIVEHYRQLLAARPKATLDVYVFAATVMAIRGIAENHEASCAGCETCDRLRRLLALVLAYELNEAPPDVLRQIHGIEKED
jgi:hypothetical protein